MSRIYDVLAPVVSGAIAVELFLVLVFLLLGPFRKYWIVFAYAAWELLATVAFTIADLLYHATAPVTAANRTLAQLWYSRLYWVNDVIVDLLRFVLVIVLIYMASEGTRRVSGRLLSGLVVVMVVLPFVLFHPGYHPVQVSSFQLPFPSASWFNSTSELLNFGAAIMNLMLWAILLPSNRRDPQLVLVSLGLGVVVTGTAIAYGVRFFVGQREFQAVGYLFMNLTQFAGWALWCRAFRPARKSRQVVDNAVPSP
jgi:hypothetical protein